MSWIHNGKNQNPEKPISGCLGRMVNLFDLNSAVGGNRLLTDKPHHDGSSFSRRQSDVSRTNLYNDQMDDDMMVSELRKSPSDRKSNGTPIKMLIAQEMLKEEDGKQSPSNLVAKLMGLDALPQQQRPPGLASYRSRIRESRSQWGSLEFLQQEHGFMDTEAKHEIHQEGGYKEGYEIWQQHCESEYARDDSPHKGRCSERQIESKMALVREKFMEAKRLSTDEKLRQSKQFQDALEVLSSNKDLFLKYLQEPNSLFSPHLCNLQSVPPPPDSRRITILRPSKLVDSHKITSLKNEEKVKEMVKMGRQKAWDKNNSNFLFSPEYCDIIDNPTQPTRIVLLKPSSVKPHNNKVIPSPPSSSLGTSHDVFDRDPENSETLESRQVAEEIEGRLRRDETLLSSVFSNGYIGDDSSFGKSEVDYAEGNLSDSEVISPTSRHSWDYVNRFNSHYSTSSSRASYSPESSVCREAKKRLSERWAMMASNKSVQEQKQIQRSSSTLGDMLALSDLKSVKSDENHETKEESRASLLFVTSDLNKVEDADDSQRNIPRSIPRSKSVPASATPGSRLSVEVSGSSKGKADDMKERLVKSSSFKDRVSSLFFSKNKRSSKEKSQQSKDVPQSAKIPIHFPRHIGNEEPQCINELVIEESSTQLHRSQRKSSDKGTSYAGLKRGIILPEVGFSFTKNEIPGSHGENQDQPSPISVLEPQFEEDDRTDCHCNPKLKEQDTVPMRCNLIDKSPPIGSIARTLSWNDSALGSSTPYASKPSPAPLNPEEEEQECLFYVETLLSVAGLDKVRSNSFLSKWHSPESPLDPSLRDKYVNSSEKQPILIQTKQRHQRAMTKLVFDCVNEALMGLAGRGPCSSLEMSSTLLKDCVWGQMKEWLSREERCDWEDVDGGSMVVERVVMKEVEGRGWGEGLRLEIDNTRKEIEGKLLEELVHESVLELTGRA